MSGVTGWGEFATLARDARLAGGKVLPDMRKGLNKLGPPAKKAVQASALAKLPKRGGFAETLSKAVRMRVRTDTGLSTASVTLITTAAGPSQLRHIGAINKGVLRHPTHGHRTRWVAQRVPPEFWDDAMDVVSTDAAARVRAVLDETTRILKGR